MIKNRQGRQKEGISREGRIIKGEICSNMRANVWLYEGKKLPSFIRPKIYKFGGRLVRLDVNSDYII